MAWVHTKTGVMVRMAQRESLVEKRRVLESGLAARARSEAILSSLTCALLQASEPGPTCQPVQVGCRDKSRPRQEVILACASPYVLAVEVKPR